MPQTKMKKCIKCEANIVESARSCVYCKYDQETADDNDFNMSGNRSAAVVGTIIDGNSIPQKPSTVEKSIKDQNSAEASSIKEDTPKEDTPPAFGGLDKPSAVDPSRFKSSPDIYSSTNSVDKKVTEELETIQSPVGSKSSSSADDDNSLSKQPTTEAPVLSFSKTQLSNVVQGNQVKHGKTEENLTSCGKEKGTIMNDHPGCDSPDKNEALEKGSSLVLNLDSDGTISKTDMDVNSVLSSVVESVIETADMGNNELEKKSHIPLQNNGSDVDNHNGTNVLNLQDGSNDPLAHNVGKVQPWQHDKSHPGSMPMLRDNESPAYENKKQIVNGKLNTPDTNSKPHGENSVSSDDEFKTPPGSPSLSCDESDAVEEESNSSSTSQSNTLGHQVCLA